MHEDAVRFADDKYALAGLSHEHTVLGMNVRFGLQANQSQRRRAEHAARQGRANPQLKRAWVRACCDRRALKPIIVPSLAALEQVMGPVSYTHLTLPTTPYV